MLAAIGASSVEELYADVPEALRLRRLLDLPPPLRSEVELARHVRSLTDRNVSTGEVLSFLGAGCYQHYVPAICDEINSRGEFLTAYAGEPYEDHGRFQALFEYASMMGELLEMDVVNVPTYDGYQAAATALRMAARITGRSAVLLPASIDRDKLSKIREYLKPDLSCELTPYEPASGQIAVRQLRAALHEDTAAVFLETPNYFGIVETQAPLVARLAHEAGALAVVAVDPITLGVLMPPARFGADIVCGDIQSLGMHAQFGGGHAGFIATRDEERFVAEYPSRLFGIVPTVVDGEYGFGDVAYERTSFAARENGKEWVGTTAALWGITAGVYLALMGPQGMFELGRGLMARKRYAMETVAKIPGIRLPFRRSHHVKEFVVDLSATGRTVAEVNDTLRQRGIFGGADVSAQFPEIGQAMLVCVTEVHTQADIDRFASELSQVLR